jgi:hypothetical protein
MKVRLDAAVFAGLGAEGAHVAHAARAGWIDVQHAYIAPGGAGRELGRQDCLFLRMMRWRGDSNLSQLDRLRLDARHDGARLSSPGDVVRMPTIG